MTRRIHHAAVAGAALLAGCTAHTPAPPRPPAPHTAPPTPPETTTSTELAVPTTDVKPTTTVHIVATTRPRPVTTRAPRPTVPVTRAPVAATGDAADAIRAAFGSAGEKAVAVARCESGLRPGARNGPHAGLFQINVQIHAALIARMGYTTAQMYTAGPNIAVARALYAESGWRPWTCA